MGFDFAEIIAVETAKKQLRATLEFVSRDAMGRGQGLTPVEIANLLLDQAAEVMGPDIIACWAWEEKAAAFLARIRDFELETIEEIEAAIADRNLNAPPLFPNAKSKKRNWE